MRGGNPLNKGEGMADREELAWASGLYEGEGNIGVHRGIVLRVAMCDEDMVRRFAQILGLTVQGPYANGEGHKDVWYAAAYNVERVQYAAAAMWSWLGRRRKDQVKAALLAAPAPKGQYQQEGRRT